ncbi:MAG: nicotinamide mononucleotide transporter [Aureispira sp.]|nr:nicotinamide mononucleotide transporter [Aureispira sp.]
METFLFLIIFTFIGPVLNIIGLILLARQIRWGWLFSGFEYAIPSAIYVLLWGMHVNSFILLNIMIVGLSIYGFIQWIGLTPIRSSQTVHEDILDSFDQTTPIASSVRTVQSLQKDNFSTLILIASVVTVIVLSSDYVFFDVNSGRGLLYPFVQCSTLLGFYILSQKKLEGWLVLIVAFVLELVNYFMFDSFFTPVWYMLFLPVKIGLAIWAYKLWKTTNNK